jgi:hypothetical protein
MTARLAYVQHRLTLKEHQERLRASVVLVPWLIAGTGITLGLRGRDNPEAVKTWRRLLDKR